MLAVVAAVGAGLLGLAIGWWWGQRRAERAAAAAAAQLRGELETASAERARLEGAMEAAGAEIQRLRFDRGDLDRRSRSAEEEKARLEHDLRQVALRASRVPELEARLTELDGLRRDLEAAEHRARELEPVAEELALRVAYIETLQREIGYRDERLLRAEARVAELERGRGLPPAPDPLQLRAYDDADDSAGSTEQS